MVPPETSSLAPQESFTHIKEKFNNMLHNNDQTNVFALQRSSSTQNILDYTTDASDADIADKNIVSYNASKIMDAPPNVLEPDIVVEPFKISSSGILSKLPKTTSFQFPSVLPFGYTGEFSNDYALVNLDENEECSLDIIKPKFEKTYSLTKGKTNLSNIPLSQSAASFYNGWSPLMEVVESSECISRLNEYLKAKRKDVKAGVPGRFLRAVMGQDLPDIGSVVSAIMYAFYLNETQKHEQLCTVPIINMKRRGLNSHAELIWLLNSCQIDHSSLLFVDEVDLSYFDLYGSLQIVLLNSDKLPAKQEALRAAVTDIFNSSEDCSCCTIIAEKFALTAPQTLAAQGLSRLLLAGILLDTENLSSPSCSSKDQYMAALLINGAGRFGLDGLYQILKYNMYGATNFKVIGTLLKDFKKWTRVGFDFHVKILSQLPNVLQTLVTNLINHVTAENWDHEAALLLVDVRNTLTTLHSVAHGHSGQSTGQNHTLLRTLGRSIPNTVVSPSKKVDNTGKESTIPHVGMSSIGISVVQLFAETDNSTKDIENFRRKERLQYLVIVSGYYSQQNFKREILLVAESAGLMRSLLIFLNSKASQLPLKVVHQPGTSDEIRAFEINKVTSRRTIEGLLEEFRVEFLLHTAIDAF